MFRGQFHILYDIRLMIIAMDAVVEAVGDDRVDYFKCAADF